MWGWGKDWTRAEVTRMLAFPRHGWCCCSAMDSDLGVGFGTRHPATEEVRAEDEGKSG